MAFASACAPRETPPAVPAQPSPSDSPSDSAMPSDSAAATASPPALYADEHESFEKRAADLVSRLSLEEKIGQLMHDAPGRCI